MNSFSKFICISILILSSNNIFSQEIRFSAGIGYGSYSMNGLKDFQNSINYRSVVTLHAIQAFPPYYNWFLGGEYLTTPHEFGVKINGQSTGGRSTYTDYSGRVDIDMIISEIAIGPTYKYHLFNRNTTNNLSLGCEVYMAFSKLEIRENTIVYEEANKDQILAYSIGLALLPNVHYRFKYKFAHCGIQLGYWIGIFNGPLKYRGNEIMDGRDKLRANWSGYRIRFEIGLGGIIKNITG